MNGWEQKLMEAFVREVRRQAGADLLRCLMTSRLELALLTDTDPKRDFDGSELAQLEEID